MRIKREGVFRSGIPPPRVTAKGGGSSPSVTATATAGTAVGAAHRDDRNSNSNDASLSDRDEDAHDLDNSDYQWFLDYNIRDNSCQHTSVLSSLSASYKGVGDLASRFSFSSRYDDLARDMDANIAEADMESFRTEDIHHLLMTANALALAPAPVDTITQHDEAAQDSNRCGEMFASITSSLMDKFRFDPSFSPNMLSQGDDSTVGSINTMSICKSELLFSPVKEQPTGAVHFSIDSLDCDLLNEQDLILTCQANKDNYTIAFEGSLTNYSEDSEADALLHQNDKDDEHKVTAERLNQNLAMLERCHKLIQNLETSMARSDTGFTTWSKLRKQADENQLKRHPSGNNNQTSHDISTNTSESQSSNSVLKSQSLPDITSNNKNVSMDSERNNAMTNSDCNTITGQQRTVRLNTGFIRVYDVSQNNSHCTNRSTGSQNSEPMSTSSVDNQTCSDKSQPKQGFSLVKLFMKQKSMSNEGIMSTTMDQSECWPNSSEGDSGDSFAQDLKSKNLKQKVEQYDDLQDRYVNNHTDNAQYILGDSLGDQNEHKTESHLKTDSWTIQEEDSTEKPNCETLNKKNVTKEAICDNESNIYATVNKTHHQRFNLNNNLENSSKSNSPIKIRGNQGTQTRKSCSSSGTSVTVSSCSDSEGTQITRLNRLLPQETFDSKSTSTQLNADLMDKSMQTSYMSGFPHFPRDKRHVRVVEQSFLEKLKQGNNQKPVYVLYPNYTLPDLSFLTNKEHDYEKILLKPQKYMPSPSEEDCHSKKSNDSRGRRPFSCNDVESLRKKGFGHIKDWESLTFLLPLECRQILAEMPEIVKHLKDREEDLLEQKEKPNFCAAANAKNKGRPVSCDCATLNNNTTNISSGSSTATQPSSGYRGSSTMLSDSSAQNSPAPTTAFNPLFVYRYDSATSSEASVMAADRQRFGQIAPRRSGISGDQTKIAFNGKLVDVAPPRPPLPKSILRKSMDKIRKTSPNTKRYSMFELDETQQEPVICYNVQTEENNSKRRSLQEPYYLLKNNSIELRKNNDLAAKRLSQQFLDAADKDGDENEYYHDEGVGTESSLDSGRSNENIRPTTPPLPKPRNKPCCDLSAMDMNSPGALISSNDLQQLEDFLKHSGISCNNMEEWDNTQMSKVRHQVSRFLSMKRSQDENKKSTDSNSSSGSKKSVSFAESKKEENIPRAVEELKVANLMTPPNSPNISALIAQRHYQVKNLAEIPICEEGELSADDFGSPARSRSKNFDISQKRALVLGVADAVELLIQHFSPAVDQEQLAKLGDSALSPASAKLALNALCPALYAIFRDGLKESIDTSFGPIDNSVWQMIEASARQGPITKALHELVLRINSEDAVTEGLVKFNAFILGLLNARSVDAWVSYIRTRESILSKHYRRDSLLYAACVGEPSCRALLDTFLASLEPLSLLPFRLDLMFEMKELHRSFKRMECDMQSHSGLRPSNLNVSSLSKNQRNILKLVHSVQSSLNISSDDQKEVDQSSVIMRKKEQSKEPSTPDLLNDSAYTRINCKNDRQRPRSCVNPSTANLGDGSIIGENMDSISDQNRRWSGVHLGSKFLQAFDRLALFDDDDYEDSLETQQNLDIVPCVDQHFNQEMHSNWCACADSTESNEGVRNEPPTSASAPPAPDKFRRLQLKWEMLSAAGTGPDGGEGSEGGAPLASPVATSVKSRIPRPVTSPSSAGKLQSPIKAHRSIPVALSSGKKVTTPPGNSSSNPRPASVPAKITTGTHSASKRTGIVNSRTSRVDQEVPMASQAAQRAALRPSSLPHAHAPPVGIPTGRRRAVSSSAGRRLSPLTHPHPHSHPQAPLRKTDTHIAKNKIVRTVCHRLSVESGQLEFREGERLRLLLEVDTYWLLCCRGEQKGLVPRSAVIPENPLMRI